MSITIREKGTGASLATGEAGKDVVPYEGNLYLTPTPSAATCSRSPSGPIRARTKGICHWVDFVGEDGRTVRDVAWVYADPKPGHEVIKDRYGFYAGARVATRQEG